MVEDRVRCLNQAPFRPEAKYVLYWAQMNRRVGWNHALLYAAELANRAGLRLLVYEGLTCSYPYASDRLHTFILEGVPDTEQRLRKLGIGYMFYLRRKRSDPDDILYQLAEEAAAVVTDDYPTLHRASTQRPRAVEARHPLLRGRFQLHRADESNGKTRVRRVHHPAENPQAASALPEAGPSDPNASQISICRFRVSTLRSHPANIAELVASCEIDHSVRPRPCFVVAQRKRNAG